MYTYFYRKKPIAVPLMYSNDSTELRFLNGNLPIIFFNEFCLYSFGQTKRSPEPTNFLNGNKCIKSIIIKVYLTLL